MDPNHYPAAIKYYGKSEAGRHPGHVIWPGVDGLPFLGEAIPNLKQKERAKLPVVGYKRVRQFDLSLPHDMEEYTWVLDHVRNGCFTLDYILRHPIEYEEEGQKRLKIIAHVEWTQLYRVLPPTMQPGGNGNGRPHNDFTFR